MTRFLIALLLAPLALADHALDLESFETVWTTVRDRHWEEKPGGLDWQAIHSEFRPKAEAAKTTDEMRLVMRQMLARLKQTHFGILPAPTYAAIAGGVGAGSPGWEFRILGGAAVVTRVEPEGGAAEAGVRPGWKIVRVGDVALEPLIAKAAADSSIHELQVIRALMSVLTGDPGTKVPMTFDDGTGERVVPVGLASERGNLVQFGNLPPQRVWFESERLGRTTRIAFNLFMDPVRVMTGFEKAISECKDCDGMILDLRGNPGGIAGMAMGMAGFFIDDNDQKLGTMHMRDTTLKFGVNPRAETFRGPLAVLLDGLSASTSEILAGGLQDLGRARVFGTRSAAAALPSSFMRLPNGDGFQFAVANYISEGGKPLEGLGVTPDQEVKLTREALLAGHDPVLDAALQWIREQSRADETGKGK